MTHHWRETATGAELLVDGVVRGRAWSPKTDWALWDIGGPVATHTGFERDMAAAQAAAERALGLATHQDSLQVPPPVNDFDPEPPRWQGPTWECQAPGCGLRWREDIKACPVHHGPGRIVRDSEPNDSESPKSSPDDRQRPLRSATTTELYAELHRRHRGLLEAIATPSADPPDASEAALLQRMGWELIGRGMGQPAGQCYGRLLALVGEALDREPTT